MLYTGNGIHERKTIEKWQGDFNSSNRKAGIVGFELGFEKKKETICWEMGSGPPPPSGPSVKKQKQQMIKLRNLGGAEKFFFLSQDEQIG